MRTVREVLAVLSVLSAILFTVVSCQAPSGATGAVTFELESAEARSILPPISMSVTEYLVSGTGPGGVTYGPELFTVSTTVEGFIPGEWNFTVVGRNAAHNDIGLGTALVNVVIGQTASATITVTEYAGNGSFLLDLAWEPDIVADPIWTGTLKDSAAVITNMSFTTDELACTADSLVDPLHAGWYTMIVQLFDAPTGIDGSEVLSTGAATAVRIAQARQTHGDLYLHAVQGFGQIDFDFDLDFHDPLVLTPSRPFGNVTMYTGESVTFTVNADETATDVYYLLGQQVGIDSYTIHASDLLEGEPYRVDVVSFNVDGSRGASGTWTVTAAAVEPARYVMTGTVNRTGQNGQTLRVAAVDSNYNEIAVSDVLASSPLTEVPFTITITNYSVTGVHLWAFRDANGNGHLDAGEYSPSTAWTASGGTSTLPGTLVPLPLPVGGQTFVFTVPLS